MLSPITSYKDIPKLPHCRYRVQIDWDFLESWVTKQRNGPGLDLEPEYQRDYVWTLDQKIKFVEYILRGGQSGRELYFNCPSWQTRYNTPLEIVDGKQRLSAALDFLQNRIPAFGTYAKDFTGYPSDGHFHMNINTLTRKLDVVNWYLGMNTGGSIHTEKDLEPAYKLKEKLEK
jgi:hypothetical protein